MEENIVDIKPISELANFSFFIPAYQRGYRWTERQVIELLNDITDFKPKEIINSGKKTWYCLQPLVLKKLDLDIIEKQALNNQKSWYEVTDGQQRLTTIYLIGHYINEMWRGRAKDKEIELKYETRPNSSDFLKNLQLDDTGNIEIDNSNIDYFYISQAYKTINEWVNDGDNVNFKQDNFIDKFLNDTKVIWYESKENDSITIFTRINMGKIPLTNAELIKALFLNSSNFAGIGSEKDTEKIRLKQLEIATEWDRIEYSLHNPEFWYFINEKENNISTRIEFIFDLMAKKPSTDDEYYTFRYFNDKFKNNSNEEITNNWNEINQYFQTINEWFIDRELYHKIGFLIAQGTKILDLLELSENSLTKSDFKKSINEKISSEIYYNFDELEYKDNTKVRKVLLLHNIQTMLDNKLETTRFPFDRYKNEKWDVEHIHSIQEKMPKQETHQKDWLIAASKYITDNELKERTENYDKYNFEAVFKDVLKYFSENGHHEEINDISNLALLDSRTNRGYGNSVFPVKRKTIIERDRNGTFIPICTKNIFLKYYSNNIEQMTFWGEQDRTEYLENLKTVLSPYKQGKIS